MRTRLFLAMVVSSVGFAQKNLELKPANHLSLPLPEPSDICYSPASDTYFIVSDNGILFETGRDGHIIRSVAQYNTDFEAVTIKADTIYAVDETHRDVYQYDRATLKLLRTAHVEYSGGRNKGFEAITAKPDGGFVMVTEKDPVWLYELDAKFNVENRTRLKIASDISAASFRDGFLYLLSDEDRTLFKLDPKSFGIISKWILPVINPEGFAFAPDGTLLVTCDDMQRLYEFNDPEKP